MIRRFWFLVKALFLVALFLLSIFPIIIIYWPFILIRWILTGKGDIDSILMPLEYILTFDIE